MNKPSQFIKRFFWVTLCGIGMMACKEEGLESFTLKENQATAVSAGDIAGEMTKNSDEVTIPVKVTLTKPAAKAFQVGLQLNVDTIAHLIEEGSLTDVYAINTKNILVPNAVNIGYGASEGNFEIKVSVSELEKYFGHDVALAYDLTDPGKENTIDKETMVIVFNTEDILKQEEIHYVSISNGGGGIIEASRRKNYSVTSAGVSIPLGISLAGTPGNFFEVTTAIDADTVATLVQDGTLPNNTIALPADQFELKDTYQVGSNLSRTDMDLIIPWSSIQENADHTLAVVVKLTETTRHILDPEKDHVVVVIYPDLVMEKDVTDLGTLTVDHDNGNANENSPKLVDGNYSSKFLQPDFRGTTWFQLAFEEPQFVGAYTITSGNDAADRDLKDWNLQGSDDGENWVTLDTRSGETFATRNLTVRYDFDVDHAYKYFRLNATDNNGSGIIQVSEWRLIQVP